MPNWCENHLTIEGRNEDLERFKQHAQGENGILDFNSFLMYPERFRFLDQIAENLYQLQKMDILSWDDIPRDGYNTGGYKWCASHCGTKWNACEPVVNSDEGYLYYDFDTAWTPPIPVIVEMGKQSPHLEFKLHYDEHSGYFSGDIHIKQGEVMAETSRDYCACRKCTAKKQSPHLEFKLHCSEEQ